MPIELPCGQCIGCRLERSRQWAIRCVHEASLQPDNNSFITLTYSPEHLPTGGTLVLDHFQKFMKRLRGEFAHRIRFFHCGEYGENFGRPHYHAILFGCVFRDRKHFKTINSIPLYKSATLEKLWTLGHSSVGDVTFESAAYVARYVTKKITGDNAIHHYNSINYQTGEILSERRPEYCTMSRRPGIGRGWYDKFKADVYPDDFVVLRGKQLKPPKYYNARYELDAPDEYQNLKRQRTAKAKEQADNNTFPRLRIREEIQTYKLKQLIRTLK